MTKIDTLYVDVKFPAWNAIGSMSLDEYRRASIWHPMAFAPPKDDTDIMLGKFGPRGEWIVAPGPMSFNRLVKMVGRRISKTSWPAPSEEWAYWMPVPLPPVPPITLKTRSG